MTDILRNVSLASVGILGVLYVFFPSDMRIMGRRIWGEPKKLIDFEQDGKWTSKQVADIYSFSHISHGILLYILMKYLGFNQRRAIYLSIAVEIIWEILENTPYIINKYRAHPEFKNYDGDSIANMIGDLMAMVVGVYIAVKYPQFAIPYLAISEAALMPIKANFIELSIGSLFRSASKGI